MPHATVTLVHVALVGWLRASSSRTMGKAIDRMSCLEAKAPEDHIFSVGGVANIKLAA